MIKSNKLCKIFHMEKLEEFNLDKDVWSRGCLFKDIALTMI